MQQQFSFQNAHCANKLAPKLLVIADSTNVFTHGETELELGQKALTWDSNEFECHSMNAPDYNGMNIFRLWLF